MARKASLVAIAVAGGLLGAARQPLSPSEIRGKQIYLRGEGSSEHPLTAAIAGGTVVPGTLMPCANCHGRDGRGKPEAGYTPSSLRWSDLTRPYEVTEPGGRKHGPYDERSFNRAVSLGFDPAGHELDPAMPRFRMTRRDLDDLIAWVKHVGADDQDGITDDTITAGSLLPGGDSQSSSFEIRAVLTAYFEQINRAGGIYGRKIDLRILELPADASARVEAVRRFLDTVQPFVLTTSFTAGFERDLDDVLSQRELPMIGAYTPFPKIEGPVNPYVFYLDSGLRGQAEALAHYLVETAATADKRVRVHQSTDEMYRRASESAVSILQKAGFDILRDGNPGRVLVLAPGFDATSMGEGSTVLVPGVLVTEAILNSTPARQGRLYLSYPVLLSDYEPTAVEEFRKLGAAAKLPTKHLTAQAMALASAHIFVEALKRAGRDVTRDKLIDVLEHFYEVHTGFTPPVSFGPNRRIGLPEAQVVTLDQSTRQLRAAH